MTRFVDADDAWTAGAMSGAIRMIRQCASRLLHRVLSLSRTLPILLPSPSRSVSLMRSAPRAQPPPGARPRVLPKPPARRASGPPLRRRDRRCRGCSRSGSNPRYWAARAARGAGRPRDAGAKTWGRERCGGSARPVYGSMRTRVRHPARASGGIRREQPGSTAPHERHLGRPADGQGGRLRLSRYAGRCNLSAG